MLDSAYGRITGEMERQYQSPMGTPTKPRGISKNIRWCERKETMAIKPLYEGLKDQFCGRCKSYYNIRVCPNELFNGNSTAEIRECCAFIEKHFTAGCKNEALNFSFKEDYRTSNRVIHMTSLYLLGLKLKVLLEGSIHDEFDTNISGDKEWYDFKYTWFLTCLYHDTASCIEESNIDFECLPNIEMSPYTTPVRKNDPGLSIAFRGSNDLARNYYEYRKSCSSVDHGIVGGYLLFDKLVCNFKNTIQNCNWDSGFMVKKGVLWRAEHIDHFRYIADAIICHNMWTVQETDTKGVEKYKKYHLDDLIIKNDDDKISLKKYSLQFMLCLIDTIEPVKRFEQLSAREVLENVSIELSGSRIRIAWTEKIRQQSEFWKWMENISTVKDWMQVDVSPCRQEGEWCYVTINIR